MTLQASFQRSYFVATLVGCLTVSATAQLIVLDDDGDRDTIAGPNVTTIQMSNHDNGGWGSATQYFNQTNAYNGDGAPDYNSGTPGAGASVTYTFDASLGVVAGVEYGVYAYWPAQVNTGPAIYNVGDGLGNVSVDQTVATLEDLLVPDPFVGDDKYFQRLGNVVEDGDGIIEIVLSNDGSNFFLADAVALLPAGVDLTLGVSVNRDTGSITLGNGTSAPVTILGYSITSDFGTLNPGQWKSIAENYDLDGDKSVDPDDTWIELTAPASRTDLSESELGGPGPQDGAELPVGKEIDLDLGNGPWIQSPIEDLVFQYLLSDGTVERGLVEYTGNGGPFEFGDLNFDGTAFGLDDFADEMLPNLVSVLPETLSLAEAYAMGDLDGDRDVDQRDFRTFKNGYIAAGGSASDLAAVAVPEPSSMFLLLCLVGMMACWRVKEFSKLSPMPTLSRYNLIVVFAVACSTALGSLCYADFAVIDNFEAYSLGDQPSVGPWTTFGTPTGTVINDTGNQVVELALTDANAGYQISLGDQTIADGTTGTIFFRARAQGSFFAYAADGATTGTWWADDEAGIFHRDNEGAGAQHTGDNWAPHWDHAALGESLAPTVQDEWDNVWLVIDNAADTYDIYVNDNVTPALTGAAIRNAPGDLTHFFFGSNDGDLNGSIDDIFVDTAGQNLTIPASNPFAPLSLEVNRTTGQIMIQNKGSDAYDIDFYQITSPLNSLDPSGWNSLENQGVTGWMKGGASNASSLVEANLTSSTVFAPSDSQTLGAAYDTSVDKQDVAFNYTTVAGFTHIGDVEYVTGGTVGGDYNGNGRVEQGDLDLVLLNWGENSVVPPGWTNPTDQPTFPIGSDDLNQVRQNWGSTAVATASAAAVPEPTSLAWIAIGMAGWLIRRGQRRRR